MQKALQQYVEHGVAVNLLKSEFQVHKTIFLCQLINGQEVKMDLWKLETMSKWPIPTKKKKVQLFLDFANYDYWFTVNNSAKSWAIIN